MTGPEEPQVEYEPPRYDGEPKRFRGRPCSEDGCPRSAEAGSERCVQHWTDADVEHSADQLRRMRSRRRATRDAAHAKYNALPGPALVPDESVAAPAVAFGPAAIVCPHCQQRGSVVTRRIRQKKGISGGKATGAILTGGLSMLGTGLSRKETVTEFRCGRCGTTWFG